MFFDLSFEFFKGDLCMTSRKSVEELRKEMKKVDEKYADHKCDCDGKCGDDCKCKKSTNYHDTHTYVIRSEHEGSAGEDDRDVSYYINLAYEKLRESGMEGGIKNRSSVKVKKGSYKGEQGVILDLPTKKRRLFFPKVTDVRAIWDLVDGLIAIH